MYHSPIVLGQAGCTPAPGCVNPVPAVDVSTTSSTTWYDGYGNTYNIASSPSGGVTGTVLVPHLGGPGCPDITFTESGSISPSTQTDGRQGFTTFSWTASNPQPNVVCDGIGPLSTKYSGTIQNNGNDYSANVAWTKNGGNGSTTLSKYSDIPISETTTAVGFGSGAYATLGQFRQVLNPRVSSMTDIFKGRQVSETTGGIAKKDSCWNSKSPYSKWTAVTGSGWNVGYYAVDPPYIVNENVWADDYIGWTLAPVLWYQANLPATSFPCGVRIIQNMYMAVDGTSGSNRLYSTGQIGMDIYSNYVVSYRDGVSQTRTAE